MSLKPTDSAELEICSKAGIVSILKNWKIYNKLYLSDKSLINEELLYKYEFMLEQLTLGVFPVMKLYYIDGMRFERIAELLDMDVRSVYKKRDKELRRLEKMIIGSYF